MEPPCKIRTIFSGLHFTGETRGARSYYVLEARERPLTNTNSLDKWLAKQFRGEMGDVTFSERDAHHVCHPHCDALVVKSMITNNNVIGCWLTTGAP